MADHPMSVTVAHLEQMMAEIQHFIDHPRIQQRRWVEKGRTWLPVLQQARAHLLAQAGADNTRPEPQPGLEVRPRDATAWGYRWDGGQLTGTYATLTQALEAALRDRLSEKH